MVIPAGLTSVTVVKRDDAQACFHKMIGPAVGPIDELAGYTANEQHAGVFGVAFALVADPAVAGLDEIDGHGWMVWVLLRLSIRIVLLDSTKWVIAFDVRRRFFCPVC